MTDKQPDKLLLQKEVAKRLGCSESKVARLRFQGKLAYIPGRPVLIGEADLKAYLDGVSEAKRQKLAAAQEEAARFRAKLSSPGMIALKGRMAFARMRRKQQDSS